MEGNFPLYMAVLWNQQTEKRPDCDFSYSNMNAEQLHENSACTILLVV